MSILEKISDYIGIERFLSLLEELFNFYLKPFSFFENFFNKERKEKLIQLFVYSLLLIAVGYITIDDITIRELAKGILAEIAFTFLICLVLVISDFLVSIVAKKKNNSENIIYFVLLAKLLIGPFQVVFFALFVSYENYNYFFIANLICLYLYIYVLLFSARVFNKLKRYILLTVLLNLLILNLFEFSINKLKIDNYSTFESEYYIDHILRERLEKGKYLKYPYSTPVYRVLMTTENNSYSHFVFATPFDTIASGSPKDTWDYINGLQSNMKILDTMKVNLKFKRNLEFFEKISTLYQATDSLLREIDPDISKIKIERTEIGKIENSNERYTAYYLSVPKRISKLNIELLKEEIELEKISKSAMLPLRIINYFYPVHFIKK